MERSSGSIMDNIAEGFGRGGNAEFHNFLSYSKGSTSELKSQFYRSIDKQLIDESSFNKLIDQCNTLENKLGAFMYYLRKSDLKGIKFKNQIIIKYFQIQTINYRPRTNIISFHSPLRSNYLVFPTQILYKLSPEKSKRTRTPLPFCL